MMSCLEKKELENSILEVEMNKALITGVNSIVNKELLEKLLKLGFGVVAHYHSDNKITEDLKSAHKNVIFIKADFSDKVSVNEFVKTAIENGPYEVVVNAAVTYSGSGDDWQDQQRDRQTWADNFSVNTIVPGMLMANADKLILDKGVIVNISSTLGQIQFGERQFAIYCASKSALDSLTATYAKRWAPNIRVVGIAPAYIRSAWNKNIAKQDMAHLLQDHLTHKFIEPEEIADLMETLIVNPSINATTVLIDGGYSTPII